MHSESLLFLGFDNFTLKRFSYYHAEKEYVSWLKIFLKNLLIHFYLGSSVRLRCHIFGGIQTSDDFKDFKQKTRLPIFCRTRPHFLQHVGWGHIKLLNNETEDYYVTSKQTMDDIKRQCFEHHVFHSRLFLSHPYISF